MKSNEIVLLKKPKLKKPVLVEGLPGLGLVGRIAVEHLIKKLKAEKFAVAYSTNFPPQVRIMPDGTVKMRAAEFYYAKGKKRDLVILAGDDQPLTVEAQYSFCEEVLSFSKKLGIKEIITLGGYGAIKQVSKVRRVFGAASTKSYAKTLEKHGVLFGKVGGDIVGVAGLLVGLASVRKVKSVCLMAETKGNYIDPKASESILKVLNSYLGLNVELKELKEKAKETEEMIKRFEAAQRAQQIPQAPKEAGPLSYIR